MRSIRPSRAKNPADQKRRFLVPHENELFMQMVAENKSESEICEALHMKLRTVREHKKRLQMGCTPFTSEEVKRLIDLYFKQGIKRIRTLQNYFSNKDYYMIRNKVKQITKKYNETNIEEMMSNEESENDPAATESVVIENSPIATEVSEAPVQPETHETAFFADDNFRLPMEFGPTNGALFEEDSLGWGSSVFNEDEVFPTEFNEDF